MQRYAMKSSLEPSLVIRVPIRRGQFIGSFSPCLRGRSVGQSVLGKRDGDDEGSMTGVRSEYCRASKDP